MSLSLNILQTITKLVQPDLIMSAGNQTNTVSLTSVLFHELGHASHYRRVGNNYWVKYINYIITYGTFGASPYGNGSGFRAPLCAIGEAWGNFLQYNLTLREFGDPNGFVTAGAPETFNPLTRPNDAAHRRGVNLNDVITDFRGWIPSGLLHDMIDNNQDTIRAGFIDRVSGYTVTELNNALDSDVESPQQFRDRLLRNSNNRQAAEVRNLFEAYFWN